MSLGHNCHKSRRLPVIGFSLFAMTMPGVAQVPNIQKISPPAGAAPGSTLVINGSDFGDAQPNGDPPNTASITFDDKSSVIPVTDIRLWSPTAIVITVPNLTPGNHKLTVTVDQSHATAFTWTDTSIEVKVPDNAPVGATNIVVSVGGIDSNLKPFTVKPSTPKLSPASGKVKTSVIITGTNYGDTQGAVKFGSVAVTDFTSPWTATGVTVLVPDKAKNDANGNTNTNAVVTVNGIDSDPATSTVQ